MNVLAKKKTRGLLIAGILWLGFTAWAYGGSLEELRSRIDQAQENLRISEATEARIASKLDQLKRSGTASPEVLKDYETYLARAHEMVVENREIVKELEGAYATHDPTRQSPIPSPQSQEGKTTDSQIPEEEEVDELASLEREFKASLAAFDEMLLEKWDEILAMSAKKMRDLREEMGEKEGHSGQEVEGEETSSGEGTSEAQGGKEDTGEGETRSEEGTEAQEAKVESGESESKGEGKGQTLTQKRPTYDGHDDDIVARQLREAAEKETDPELKAKLWKEYEEYKRESKE